MVSEERKFLNLFSDPHRKGWQVRHAILEALFSPLIINLKIYAIYKKCLICLNKILSNVFTKYCSQRHCREIVTCLSVVWSSKHGAKNAPVKTVCIIFFVGAVSVLWRNELIIYCSNYISEQWNYFLNPTWFAHRRTYDVCKNVIKNAVCSNDPRSRHQSEYFHCICFQFQRNVENCSMSLMLYKHLLTHN